MDSLHLEGQQAMLCSSKQEEQGWGTRGGGGGDWETLNAASAIAELWGV